jgi:hypothetical protein
MTSDKSRAEHRRAFDRAFGRRREPDRMATDDGNFKVQPGNRGGEGFIRTKYPRLIGEVGRLVRAANLNPTEVESLLNVLARDLLPSHYLCKVRKV